MKCYIGSTMARRVLYILLAVMTLQLSWNVVTGYCMHETGRAANHFGHNEHIASPDELSLATKDKSHPVKMLAVHDAYCTSHAHLTLATPEMVDPPALATIVESAVVETFVSPTSADKFEIHHSTVQVERTPCEQATQSDAQVFAPSEAD